MGLMFAKRRAQAAKDFKGSKAKAHANNHKKAHEAAGNHPVGAVVSKPAEAPKAEQQNGANKPGAK